MALMHETLQNNTDIAHMKTGLRKEPADTEGEQRNFQTHREADWRRQIQGSEGASAGRQTELCGKSEAYRDKS